MTNNYKIGIVGGTGYTGVELLRILVNHPDIEVSMITSRSEQGVRVDDMFPSLRGFYDLAFEEPDIKALSQCDLVFFATPNGVAMKQAKDLLSSGVKVIDLAADFRIKDLNIWSHWYGMTHEAPDIVEQAIYGLPELYREQIKKAQIVANPGCYATAVQIGLIPLVESGLFDTQKLIANAVSGVSGAGRSANVGTLYSEVNDSFKSYATAGHRHLPEIRQQLESIAGTTVDLTFVPHLVPMNRGIHATLYAFEKQETDIQDIQSLYEQRYANEWFVDVMPPGSHPETRAVKSSNFCRLAIHKPQGEKTIVILSVVDNLVKGASGQAVQNMNIMLGLKETTGLEYAPLLP